MKSLLLSRQAIHRVSLLSAKTPTFCRSFSAITPSISHSEGHPRSYDELSPSKNAEIPRPISSFSRYFHCTRESRLSESSASQIDDSNDQEEDDGDEDGTTNEFLSRFVWIMRGKVSEAYPDCDKKMVDGMLLLIVQKVVEEIERGGFNKVGSAPPSPSSEFSDDLWSTIWEVSNTVLKDMEKERKKEKMKQYVQSPEVMEMCRFAGEIGIRGDLLRELRFKWAREKMEDAEFYESLERQRDLDNSVAESETVDGEEEEGAMASEETQPRSISLPKRKGKFKYKIYGLELSDSKWSEVADKIHEAEEEADWREPKPVTGKCKLVMEKLESLQEGDDPSGLLAEWVELLEPQRVDWIALLNQLREANTYAYTKVAELVLDDKSFKASISDYSKLIHIHAKENHTEDVERVLKKMSQNGIFPDISTATALIHMYSKSGNLERATEAFESLKSYGLRPDNKIYTSLIMGYVNAGKPKLAERLMRDMEARDIKCSEEVYMPLLRAFAQMGYADGVAGVSMLQLASKDPQSFEVYSLLVEAYAKAGKVDQAKTNFELLRRRGHKPDDKCIANMVKAYKGENSLDKALRLLLKLEKDGIEIGVITYTVLVDWMANLGLIEEAEQLLVKISQLGEAPPFELQVSLCYMYSIARNEKKTLQALGVLEAKKDQMGPNEFEKVITGLKMGGFEKDARRMFKHMEARKFLPSDRLKIDMGASPSFGFSNRARR
ncbi:unnamed protein product [Thlaspi arvense]|uniref:Pentacotripeptide-repeat region of PRORP domain-containing protein n=1 Tax=Thlaspi arvense TaxID=13288 RepID=A0AAU9RDW2_THLAR|nr:unnamed protein product [Thlaspi arvense]